LEDESDDGGAKPIGPGAAHGRRGLTADDQFTIIELIDCGDEVQQCRLATAGRSADGDELAALDVEVEPVERDDSSVFVLLDKPSGMDGERVGRRGLIHIAAPRRVRFEPPGRPAAPRHRD